MNKTVNTVIWIVLFLLLLPSSLAVASWNSLPGSRLFQVKLFMEQGLVIVTPGAAAKGSLQIAYTSRRLSEAKQLIVAQSSSQGLSYLDHQVDVTKQAILGTRDPVVKRQLAQKYVASLRDVSVQLEEQKQIAAAAVPPVRDQPSVPYAPPSTPRPEAAATPTPRQEISQPLAATPTPTHQPIPTPFIPPPPTAQGTAIQVVGSITQTQDNIESAIKELEEESGNDKNNQGRGNDDKKDKGNDKDKGKGND